MCDRSIPNVTHDIEIFLEDNYLNIRQLKTKWLYAYVTQAIEKSHLFSIDDAKSVYNIKTNDAIQQLISSLSADKKVIVKAIGKHMRTWV